MRSLFDNHHVRRILDCGEYCGMQVHPLKDKKPYWRGMGAGIRALLGTEPDGYEDSEYWPDPSRDDLSEFNTMNMLVEAGYYERIRYEWHDSQVWEWRATPKGKALIEEYSSKGFLPERNPHESIVPA